MSARIKLLALPSAIILCLGLFTCLYIYKVHAMGFVVDSNLDTSDAIPGDGTCATAGAVCTLRAAIQEANALAGPDTITFNAPMTITPGSTYNITSGINFDGTAGAVGDCTTKVLGVVIDGGSNGGDNVFNWGIGSDNTMMQGFVIKNYSLAGINIADSSNHTMVCNMIGVDEAGVTEAGGTTSISVTNATNETIGGTNPGDGNILSGNTASAVYVTESSGISIFGNIIGLDKTGSVSMASSESSGIQIEDTSDIIIGGSTAGARNVVAGHIIDPINSHEISIMALTVDISNITIQGNYIGMDSTGAGAVSSHDGVSISPFLDPLVVISNVLIGGSSAGEGNVIGNLVDSGISLVDITGAIIQGNHIGVAADGITAAPITTGSGISFSGVINGTIGGSTALERNIIGNIGGISGIYTGNSSITDNYTSNITIKGNYIGVGSDGMTDEPNNVDGISIGQTDILLIGGSNAGEGNVIGNSDVGIDFDKGSTDVTILGNYIGVASNGTTAKPNGTAGIWLTNTSDPLVGGIALNEPNLIKNSGVAGIIAFGAISGNAAIVGNTITDNTKGILVESSTTAPGNPILSILKNTITDNGGYGIDIAANIDSDILPDQNIGPDTNDITDPDTGPNGLLNHPVIEDVNAGTDTITYTLDVPAGFYQVDFFKNPTNGIGGAFLGEGETWAASSLPKTSTGTILPSQTFVLVGLAPSDVITATVTECTDITCTAYLATSEFSNSAGFSTSAGIDMGTASGETLMSANGAYHILTDSYLGSCANSDLGDGSINDTNGSVQSGAFIGTGPCTNDTDGVTFDHTSYTINTTITSTVTASADGFIHIWLDNNHDGDFDDSGEHVVDDQPVTTGSNTITFSAPPVASTHYARFRFTTTDYPSLAPQGEAIGGEVEDYALTITDASGGGGGGGCTSNCGTSGTQFACKDPLATNYYTGSAVSKPSLCLYGTTQPPLIPTNPTPDVCPVFTKYYRKGDTGGEIPKIQSFLNKELGIHLSPDGIYGTNTANAVGMFQQKYTDYILKPWHPPFSLTPTKRWYKTTAGTANIIAGCPSPSVILEDNGVNWTFSDAVIKFLKIR